MEAEWGKAALGRDAFVEEVWRQGNAAYRDSARAQHRRPICRAGVGSDAAADPGGAGDELLAALFRAVFPTVDALAAAATSDVLELWQGLGYNRRALLLKRAAEHCSDELEGTMPRTYEGLLALPGVGPATAAGVCAFAYQKSAPYLETNVRSVFLHLLFPDEDQVPDKRLAPYVADCARTEEPRGWNYALLDFGAQLKAGGENPSRRSAGYSRQSPFVGSPRQKRAAMVRCVLGHPEGIAPARAWQMVEKELATQGVEPADEGLRQSIVLQLLQEGFFRKKTACSCPKW